MREDDYSHPNLESKIQAASASASYFTHSSTRSSATTSITKNAMLQSNSGGGGGGIMLEARVAKLESDVENIKTNLAEARGDISILRESSASTSRDVAVILQKMVDVDDKLSKKPSKNDVEVMLVSTTNKLILWLIATSVALLGLGLAAARLFL